LVTKVEDSSLNKHYKEEIEENQEYEIDEETKELFESANLQYLQGKHQKAIDICLNILTNYLYCLVKLSTLWANHLAIFANDCAKDAPNLILSICVQFGLKLPYQGSFFEAILLLY
jgi:hypothetical protein